MVVLSLLLVGSESVRGFCIAMTVGIVAGTYSTIYIASALLLLMNVQREDVALALSEDLGTV
jgi:preprotein translocase subunit SecF